MKNVKHDNTNAPAKIALRKHFLDLMHPRKILECYAGEERQMYHACYQGYDVTALDIKGGRGVKKIDNRRYVRNHADEYDFFDLDAYGSPYPLLATLLARRTNPAPFTVIITDGTKLNLSYQHPPYILGGPARIPKTLAIPGLRRFHGELVHYLLRAMSDHYNVEFSHLVAATGKLKNMAYFGFIARKRERHIGDLRP